MTLSVYLDYAAGAPLRPEARAAALSAMDAGGNPSSVHGHGRRARRIVEDARRSVARLADAREDDVVFTSGAVEANNWVVTAARQLGAERVLISVLEHPSVVAAAHRCGLPVERVPACANGQVDLEWLKTRLSQWTAADGRPFVALTAACYETGVVQPLVAAAALVHAAGGWLHVDAVAAFGKTPLTPASTGAASFVVSGHKIGGLSGCGALILGPAARVSPFIVGGGQERGLRAGTENLAGVAAFGAAATCAYEDLGKGGGLFHEAASERVVVSLVREGAVLLGSDAPRLPAFACLATAGFRAQTQVMALDLEGVMVSAGAACTSGAVKPSPVLEAMGFGALAADAIRISGGWASGPDDFEIFARVWRGARARLQARQGREREVA